MAIEPEAATLAARFGDADDIRAIRHRLKQMKGGEAGLADPLDADIAFHVAILRSSKNPFYAQFQSVVSTARRTSIGLHNRKKERSANIADHTAVADAIEARDSAAAKVAMTRIIGDVLTLIGDK